MMSFSGTKGLLMGFLLEYDKNEYFALLSQNQQNIEALQEELQAAKILLGVE